MSKRQGGKQASEGTDRRDFLKLAGLGSIAGGTALVAGKDEAAADSQQTGRGYRETDHVKTYYQLAKF